MDRGLYIAASGMLAQQARQDAIANDLANASTAGYKADHVEQKSFGDMLLANTRTGQQIGGITEGVRVSKIVTDFQSEPLKQTDEPLDMGIEGQGFFGVQTAQGVKYTRNGQFRADAQNQLVDQMGNKVLGQNGKPITLKTDGTVDASSVGVFKVDTPAKQGDNYFTGKSSGKGAGTVRTSMLEGSGVNPTTAIIDMMTSMRAFEAGQKAINTIDDTLQKSANQVGSLNS
jgi:flagellar basal-body rod protein FlgF